MGLVLQKLRLPDHHKSRCVAWLQVSAFHAEPSHPQPAENALDFWDIAAPRVSEQFDQQKADPACPLRLVIHRWDFWHGGWHVARVAGCSWNILKHHLTRLYACRGLSLCLGGLDSAVCPEVAFFHLLMAPDGSFSKVVVFAAFLRQKFPIVASASMHTLETSRVEGFSHETLNHEWAPIGKRTSIAIYTVTLTQPSNLKLKLDWPGLPDTQHMDCCCFAEISVHQRQAILGLGPAIHQEGLGSVEGLRNSTTLRLSFSYFRVESFFVWSLLETVSPRSLDLICGLPWGKHSHTQTYTYCTYTAGKSSTLCASCHISIMVCWCCFPLCLCLFGSVGLRGRAEVVHRGVAQEKQGSVDIYPRKFSWETSDIRTRSQSKE